MISPLIHIGTISSGLNAIGAPYTTGSLMLNKDGRIVALPTDFNFLDRASRNQTTKGSVAPIPPIPSQPEKKVSNVLILTGS
ncbi:hypothetical protein D3C80_1426030 [compost metagenome]